MHHLVFGINFQIHFVNLVSPVSIHLLVHLSTHFLLSCPLSASFTPSLSLQAQNLPFQQILPILTLLKFIFSFSFYILFISCGRLSWLSVSFLLHVKYTVSYRIRIVQKELYLPKYEIEVYFDARQ